MAGPRFLNSLDLGKDSKKNTKQIDLEKIEQEEEDANEFKGRDLLSVILTAKRMGDWYDRDV
jgi:hypothetical protein